MAIQIFTLSDFDLLLKNSEQPFSHMEDVHREFNFWKGEVLGEHPNLKFELNTVDDDNDDPFGSSELREPAKKNPKDLAQVQITIKGQIRDIAEFLEWFYEDELLDWTTGDIFEEMLGYIRMIKWHSNFNQQP